jgi:hypothetical protein
VNDVTAAPARYSERVLDISIAMYACSPPRVLPCSPGRSRIKDAELFDDHAGAGLLHPTALAQGAQLIRPSGATTVLALCRQFTFKPNSPSTVSHLS